MTGIARRPADALERQIEFALEPGRFIGDSACFSFVSNLEEVEDTVAGAHRYRAWLGGRPVRGVPGRLFREGEELDESSGSFGMFVAGLCCGWVTARQAAGAAPEQTAARLLAWMDDDPFGARERGPARLAGRRAMPTAPPAVHDLLGMDATTV